MAGDEAGDINATGFLSANIPVEVAQVVHICSIIDDCAAVALAGPGLFPEVEPVVSAEVGEAKTDFGSTKWKIVFEIVAPIKVPRELCTPNETLIREAIKMGELTIPDGMKEITEHGIRFFKEVKVVDHGR